MPEPAVLLVSRRGDTEFGLLAQWLSRIGIGTLRLDADNLDGLALTFDPDDGTIAAGGRRIRPTVTWVRHFDMRASDRRAAPDHRMLWRDSWEVLVRQFGTELIGGADPGRLEQHRVAAEAGIRTPRTVVTTCPATVRDVFDRPRYLIKALHRHYVEPQPGRLAWFHPVVLDAGRLDDATGFADAPVLVQEYVPHDRELRVYLAGAAVHAFEVTKEAPEDIWRRPGTVRVRPVSAPAEVVAATRLLAARWHLAYGAFDFLLDADGPVFLEVNPHGDWRWFERRAGVTAVSVSAAQLVRDLHRRRAPFRRADLLTFLGSSVDR